MMPPVDNARSFVSANPAQRIVAVCFLSLQCLLLWKLMDGMAGAIIYLLLTVIACQVSRRQWLPPLRFLRWASVITICQGIKYFTLPHELSPQHTFVYSELAYEIVCLLILLQIFLLATIPCSRRLPSRFPILGGLAIVFVGDVQVTDAERSLYAVSGSLGVMMIMLLLSERRTYSRIQTNVALRRFLFSLPVVLGSLAGALGSRILAENEKTLSSWIADLTDTESRDVCSGFTGRAGLHSITGWSEFSGETMMLRVHGANSVTYLGGCAFDHFDNNVWTASPAESQLREISSDDISSFVREDDGIYRLKPGRLASPESVVDIWPEQGAGGQYFLLPRSANCLITQKGAYTQDSSGNVKRKSQHAENHYRVLLPSKSRSVDLTDNDRSLYLQLAVSLDERVTKAAHSICDGAESAREKIRRVENYFHNNFEYGTRIYIPRREDPLGYFLENKPAAHCEYFATAAVVILREAGVPARFVTGYVAGERSSTSGVWIARRKDAHAWVEAFDEEQSRWVLVEPTPGTGVPQARETSGLAAWQQAIRMSMTRFMDSIKRIRLYKFVTIIAALGGLWYLTPLIYSLLTRIKRSKDPSDPGTKPEFISHLTNARISVELMLKRSGFERHSNETVHQFAARIGAAQPTQQQELFVRWYELYESLRFDPHSHQSIEQLIQITGQLRDQGQPGGTT
ncbi:MAG: transglutaminase domain-containing protein [Planctomycetaceae bacterium]|nr:transglutaminase domain-containing protein [Planctomycetaceae bacterium]